MKLARLPDGSPEIFFTLQGEGRHTGLPSVFIRASLCNLHCRWCDTDYTWNWDDTSHAHDKDADPSYRKYRREDQILDLSAAAIVEAVSAYPCRHYVFTGGEPLLQEKAWVTLMTALLETAPSSTFEIESNGTLLPGAAFLDRIDQINLSPKLANSGVARELRYKPAVLEALAATGKADFKFVIGDVADLTEVLDLLKDVTIPPSHIFLMPKAISVAELEANQTFVAALAQEHGFRYSDRLHLRLFGAKRGV
ncbi:MAG: 7-carboxy-7-deazaguanine synthase QueE [Verrucomicrobiales bacterium]|jgi:7-carboxy-7-deazaguanine synthase|nr:7-carboxy-7-deazaguanine synthase QueE [Verrucomicrobiales bacterium]MDP4939305.1 7-carboxy-7-deazaguanine synthase QueE [Verrucomicrobiales bacterium]